MAERALVLESIKGKPWRGEARKDKNAINQIEEAPIRTDQRKQYRTQ
jgi:hypothetical protein